MLANPKERSDDTVVYPVNLSMLYLAITLLKPSPFKRSPTQVFTETTVSLQKENVNESNWTVPGAYI